MRQYRPHFVDETPADDRIAVAQPEGVCLAEQQRIVAFVLIAQEAHILHQAAFDHRIGAVESARARLAIEHLVDGCRFNQSTCFRFARRLAMAKRMVAAELVDLSGGDYDAVPIGNRRAGRRDPANDDEDRRTRGEEVKRGVSNGRPHRDM
jgi:hypothetical protein